VFSVVQHLRMMPENGERLGWGYPHARMCRCGAGNYGRERRRRIGQGETQPNGLRPLGLSS
jgi:hypothetical protein